MSKSETRLEEIKQWYLSNFEAFEQSLNGSHETPFHQTRKEAIASFSALGFPTTRDEEWKYTNVAPILQHRFRLPDGTPSITPDSFENRLFGKSDKNLLVFVNGEFVPSLSRVELPDKVTVRNLQAVFADRDFTLTDHLGKLAGYKSDGFIALNTAFVHDGVMIHVPAGVNVADYLHIVHLTTETDAEHIASPRNLIHVESGAQLTVIESYLSLDEGAYFNNLVTESIVGANARLTHLKIQDESPKAYHVSTSEVRQERDSYYASINIDLGGALVRNNLNITLNGSNSETHMYGFYFGIDEQHIDNHTFIDHAVPNCFSNELYKGVLDDKATGVFNGKIMVRQDAQKTNALQSNKTLLLTNDASVNAKPQLEIFADDVKCTHGATIGQLDDEALFYLRARGISEEMAGAMLRHAFISDVLKGIESDEVREKLDARIIERFRHKVENA